MKRLLILLVVLSMGSFVVLFPPPSSQSHIPEVAEPNDQVAFARVVHCPWLRADGAIGTELIMAADRPFEATVSVPWAGEVVAQRAVGGMPFGVLSTIDLLGDTLIPSHISAIVEFSGEASGAVVMGNGEGVLASIACAPTGPAVWQLAGGSTLTGMDLELRLFNPFPQDAVVAIRVMSENDLEPESTLESLSVRAQSTRVIDIGSLLDLRQVLAFSITDPAGLVVPSLAQTSEGGDGAGWTGVASADVWNFPFTSGGATSGVLVLTNDEPIQASYDIDAYAPDGSVSQLWQGVLEPRTVMEIPVDDLRVLLPDPSVRPFGVRVRADAPIAAFLIGTGPKDTAAMAGLPTASQEWIVAGPGGAESNATVWVMNPGQTVATVTLQRSSNDGGLLPAEKFAVPAGSVFGISTARGMILEADQPISVAWIGSSVGTTVYTGGIALSDA